jgi:hypothetical protein
MLSQIVASHDKIMCAAGACGAMAGASLAGGDSADRSGTWRATSGLAAGFGYE